jgi:hypothetical protein
MKMTVAFVVILLTLSPGLPAISSQMPSNGLSPKPASRHNQWGQGQSGPSVVDADSGFGGTRLSDSISVHAAGRGST